MTWIVWLVAALVVITIALSVYVRSTEMRPADWHVRPSDAVVPSTPNYALYRGDSAVMVEGDPAAIAAMIDAAAMEAGWTSIAGDPAQGFVTYVARTRLMGFPDAISVEVSDAGDGVARIDVFARARFGQSDMGVNENHVRLILAAANGR